MDVDNKKMNKYNILTIFLIIVMICISSLIFIYGRNKSINENVNINTLGRGISSLLGDEIILDNDLQYFKNYISDVDIEDLIYYHTNQTMDVRELILCKTYDKNKMDVLIDDINTYLNNKKTQFISYGVDQYDMLENAILRVDYPYLIFIVDYEPNNKLDFYIKGIYDGHK